MSTRPGAGFPAVAPAGQRTASVLTLVAVFMLSLPTLVAAFQAPPAPSAGWTVPRLADGTPDFQGNWSNATMTPIFRGEGQALVLQPEQIAAMEGRRQDLIEAEAQPSDPDREAPPVGGDGSTGAAGGVGGYNYFFIDAGDRVAWYNGEPRASLVVSPADGRRPSYTEEGRRRIAERTAFVRQFGQYDNPENRPLAERCIMSFGSNAGPPMLPNYFYNNNYTIVQTPDAIMIMTEMVHDVRIIRMGEAQRMPEHMRPWMGDSWGSASERASMVSRVVPAVSPVDRVTGPASLASSPPWHCAEICIVGSSRPKSSSSAMVSKLRSGSRKMP